jgi:hypothetical protein
VRFAGHGGGQVLAAAADGQAGGRVARAVFQEFQVPVGMAGFTFGGGAEQHRHVVLAFHVGLVGEVEVAAVGLRFAGKGVLQVLFGLRTLQGHGVLLVCKSVEGARGCRRHRTIR